MKYPTRIDKRGIKFSWSNLLNKMVSEGKVAQAVIMTPSLRKVFEIFGSNILKVEAMGSKQDTGLTNNLQNLGFDVYWEKTGRAIMKYRNDYQTILKDDDLSEENIKKIILLLEEYKIIDCAVTYLKVKIKDEKLKLIVEQLSGIKIDTDTFIAEFESGHCEGKEGELDTKIWDGLNKELTCGLGFKKTILNCIKLIDETSNLSFKNDDDGRWIINWKPKIDLDDPLKDIISPKKICEALADTICTPIQKWAWVKDYKKTSENKLSLVDIY